MPGEKRLAPQRCSAVTVPIVPPKILYSMDNMLSGLFFFPFACRSRPSMMIVGLTVSFQTMMMMMMLLLLLLE